MKAVTDLVPCSMEPGQIRRVPSSLDRGVVGYHLACPCGWRNLAIHGKTASFSERDGLVFLDRPFPCQRCRTPLIVDGLPVVGGMRLPAGGCCRG